MILTDIVKSAWNYRSSNKVGLDSVLDPLLLLGYSASATLIAGDMALNKVNQVVDKFEGAAMFGTYAGLLVGSYVVGKKVVLPGVKKINKFHKERLVKGKRANITSWIKTFGLAGTLAYGSLNLGLPLALQNYKLDAVRINDKLGVFVSAFERESNDVDRIAEAVLSDKAVTDLEKLFPKDLDPKKVKNSDPNTLEGRFLRSYRWENITRPISERKGIPPGYLAGLCMQEGLGDPLQIAFDGGVGGFMFQPGTGRYKGLKVYGTSNRTGRDRNHAKKMKALRKKYNWDYEVLSKIDERFDVVKSAEAAADYLRDYFDKHGSWEKAISAYNRGRPAKNPGATRHVQSWKRNTNYYIEELIERGLLAESDRAPFYEKPKKQFAKVRTRADGKDVIEYHVKSGDNPTKIASRFNRHDNKNGNDYEPVGPKNVVNGNGQQIKQTIHPGQVVYILTSKSE